MIWIAALAVLIVGILFSRGGRGMRRRLGLGEGRTIALDNRTLYSRRHSLSGRPDRIVSEGGNAIPEEWKSAARNYDSHRAQLGCYFILIEEETGVAPPHGFVVTGDGQRVKVDNTPELRKWVLDIAERIRQARRHVAEPIRVRQPPGKCRGCGMREGCGQRSD